MTMYSASQSICYGIKRDNGSVSSYNGGIVGILECDGGLDAEIYEVLMVVIGGCEITMVSMMLMRKVIDGVECMSFKVEDVYLVVAIKYYHGCPKMERKDRGLGS